MTAPIGSERDGAYWDALYQSAHVVLYRTAAMILSADEAEDVVQDAFERAARADGFRSTTREPIAWLRTVTARIALDRLRRRRLWERVRLALLPGPQAEPSTELHDALQQLPPRPRVALILRFYQDASYDEIAEALSVKPESVGPLLGRAKQLLREALRD